MARPTVHRHAPQRIGGYRVIAATADPIGYARNGDGSPAYYAGVARIVREDGKEAVVWYDEENAQAYANSAAANMYSQRGVDYIAHWVSASTARKHYRAILSDSL
jgi:hypothetical protein